METIVKVTIANSNGEVMEMIEFVARPGENEIETAKKMVELLEMRWDESVPA